MSFTEPGGEHVLLGAVPTLAVTEVEAVRNVAMSVVRERAHRVHVAPEKRAIRFLIYHNSGGVVGSDLTDEMLGVSVRRKGPRQHTMRISFLEMVLSESERYANHREVYAFDWLDDRGVLAHKLIFENFGKILHTRRNEVGNIVDTVEPRAALGILPIEATDCDALCNRMLTFAYGINASDSKTALQ